MLNTLPLISTWWNMVVVMWWSGAESGSGWLAVTDRIINSALQMKILQENICWWLLKNYWVLQQNNDLKQQPNSSTAGWRTHEQAWTVVHVEAQELSGLLFHTKLSFRFTQITFVLFDDLNHANVAKARWTEIWRGVKTFHTDALWFVNPTDDIIIKPAPTASCFKTTASWWASRRI